MLLCRNIGCDKKLFYAWKVIDLYQEMPQAHTAGQSTEPWRSCVEQRQPQNTKKHLKQNEQHPFRKMIT